jgi:hypothetical protein
MSISARNDEHGSPAKPVSRAAALSPPVESVMHPHVYRIALVCWMCFLAVFWVTFSVSSNALFQVVIGTVYAVIFFGVPYEMSRIFPKEHCAGKSIWRFLQEPFRVRTGTMRGYEALLQVILVPILLTIGGTAIGFIIRSARSAM